MELACARTIWHVNGVGDFNDEKYAVTEDVTLKDR